MDAREYLIHLTRKQIRTLLSIIVFGSLFVYLNEFYITTRLKPLEQQIEQLKLENQKLQEEVKIARRVKKLMYMKGRCNQEVYDAIMNQKYISPDDAAIIACIESEFKPGAYNKFSHTKGIMQIAPCHGKYSTYDIKTNVEFGCKYFREQLDRFGTIEKAVWAYNAGPARVGKYLPAETAAYIKKFQRLKREIDA